MNIYDGKEATKSRLVNMKIFEGAKLIEHCWFDACISHELINEICLGRFGKYAFLRMLVSCARFYLRKETINRTPSEVSN